MFKYCEVVRQLILGEVRW